MRQITRGKSVNSASALIGGAAAISAAMLAVFISATPLSAHASANVFDDAVFWFRGGKDLNDDGYMRQQGEFFDDIHANDTMHANHNMAVLTYSAPALADGFKSNAVFHTENVVFPALGDQISKSVPVLHLSNNGIPYSGKTYYWPQYVKPYSVFNENQIFTEYTLVSRLRLDDDGRARTQCVFKVGYDASNNQGMWLGFSELDKTTKTKYITGRRTPSIGEDDAPFSFDNFHIPTNTWFDLAVVVGNGKLRVRVTVPKAYQDNPTIFFAETNMVTSSYSSLEGAYRLFCETGQDAQQYSVSSIDQTFFLGSVQQLAIWGRALSDQEVMDAFGMPRPVLFRVGLDNGASNEFGGTRNGSTQTFDGLGSWQSVWNTMRAGDKWTVKFNALRDEAGLAQILSIKTLSGWAQIEPTLNDQSLGLMRVAADAHVFWPVARDLVRAGENTLVIERKSGGVGDFLIDAMELGGSLGVGTDDESIDDGRTAPARTATGVPSAADPNLQHWPQGLQPYTGITNLHLRVWIDPDVADKASFTFRAATQCANRSATQEISGGENFSIFVNGEYMAKRRAETDWKKHKLEFQPGELCGGWNDFEFVCPGPYPTCHWLFDYFSFETVLPSPFGFSPFPGMSVIIR